MNEEINALVLKTAPYKESSVLLTVLSKENGKQNVLCRGVKRSKKEKLYAEKLAYSKMRLYVGRGVPIVDEAELTEPFYAVRSDIERLSLAEYFCEVALSVPFGGGDEGLLRLMLNSLWLLCEQKLLPVQIKTVFELKFAEQEGFAPSEFACACGSEATQWSFQSGFVCRKCGSGADVSAAQLSAIRHILENDGRRAYSFKMNDEALYALSKITEKYLQYSLDTQFKTLDYYNKFTEVSFG